MRFLIELVSNQTRGEAAVAARPSARVSQTTMKSYLRNPRLFYTSLSAALVCMTGIIKRLGVTKQDGSKLNGHHSEPAITRERQRFSKIHESNRSIFMWRSRSCLSCGVEVNAVPDDRMNDTQNNYRNPTAEG